MISHEEPNDYIHRGISDLDSKQPEEEQIITALDLSHKNLKEFSLPKLKEYKSLKRLYLEKNFLKELPENLFQELPFLSWLDVRNNQLTDFPKSVANHEHLEVILLQGNNIQALPLELGLVPKLRGLQISGNPIIFPPVVIIRRGISCILKYLRDECKTCSAFEEDVNDDEKLQHVDDRRESGISIPENLQDSSNYGSNIRRNTTGCIASCQHFPTANNNDCVTNEISTEEHNQTTNSPGKVTPTCKSSIRIMTNPKAGSNKIRNSAPIMSRFKTGRTASKSSTNKAATNGKHILMRQNAIIQKRKSEEALKSWRDQMHSMKEKSSNLKNCMPIKEKLFPYDTDKEYMKMPSREMLNKVSLDQKKQAQRSFSSCNSSTNIGEDISLIFKSLQSLKCTKETALCSPRTQQKAAKEKLLKINQLNSAIGDLKKKMLTKGP